MENIQCGERRLPERVNNVCSNTGNATSSPTLKQVAYVLRKQQLEVN